MSICSFFDSNYKTPTWLKQKLSRRNLLKSAAGASAIASIRVFALSHDNKMATTLKKEPWVTIDAVLLHLLPASSSGPSAIEIQSTQYLYNLIHQQPTTSDEIEFIYKGVGWLNSYSNGQTKQNFSTLPDDKKEQMLRAISRSTAGENWLSMLMSNIFEAMLTAPSYGGNPDGIGWKWLQHQAGFPLPQAGQRYYELPLRSRVRKKEPNSLERGKDIYANQSNKKQVKGI